MAGVAVLLSLIIVSRVFSPTVAETRSGQAELAADGSVHLQWRVHDGNITCRLDAATQGWVGFGLSPNGGMKHSDMIVAGVRDGHPYLMDMHTADSYQLIADRHPVSHLVAAWENSTSTTVIFTRPLTPSCEPHHVTGDNRDITADTQRVLFAYHALDPERPDAPAKHQHRGQRSIHLLDPAAGVPPPPPSQDDSGAATTSLIWRLAQQRAVLPDESTVYWCSVVRAPRLSFKHHVVKYRPLLEPGHERFVHHMVVYECSGRDFSGLAAHVDAGGGGYRCYSANMPPEAYRCRGIIAGWGIGGEEFEFPENAGYPMGPDHGSEFYVLETHYDLQDRTGVVDSSGLEFTLTPQLREQDASLLTLGHDITQLQLVPPGLQQLTIAGHCSDECLQLGLPEDGITVFAALPHTHLLGRQIRLRHFRNGKEVLPPIVRDDHYDFNYQQPRHVAPRKVMRGDQLTVECVYSSTDRRNTTLGGRSTQEEMCVVFAQYYPAVRLAQCVSSPEPQPVLAALGISQARGDRQRNIVVTPPGSTGEVLLQQYADELTWTEERLAALNAAAVRGTHETECYQYGRHDINTIRNTAAYPADTAPQGWLERKATCERTGSGATLAPSLLLTVFAAAALWG